MKSDKEILTGLVTVAALVCMLTAERVSNLARVTGGSLTQTWGAPAEQSSIVNEEKEAAYAAARRSLTATLSMPGKPKWGTVEEAGFEKTSTANFLALQVQIPNDQGKLVLEHWVIELEPGTNRVLGQVCRETAHGIGANGE